MVIQKKTVQSSSSSVLCIYFWTQVSPCLFHSCRFCAIWKQLYPTTSFLSSIQRFLLSIFRYFVLQMLHPSPFDQSYYLITSVSSVLFLLSSFLILCFWSFHNPLSCPWAVSPVFGECYCLQSVSCHW